ncbi:APC family permease [Agromyces binzhouensis]|uniref:APC family permease n=1 Tax=Agromyces binzhouensis TaxID=1817495 RepID=A0A4Q2JNX8_9MICO|nr:APC family permease [Agromyces binzhouensis]RXZ49682.1 APC family permease [Agromyces binzhouensis]
MTQQIPETIESGTPPARQAAGAGRLAGGRLRVWDIVFFVVSAAAPLTVVASAAPTTMRLGGVGAAGAILVCGAILVFFAVGFTAMSRHVRNTGAFYAYASRGLGKPVGIGTALVTVFAYIVLSVSFYGFLGFFAQLTFANLVGLDLPWPIWSLIAVACVAFLGYRKVDVGAKVLAVLLTAEVGILLVLSIAVLVNGGPEPWSAAPFAPEAVFLAPGVAALFVTGFGAYIGFEGTAIYSEEAKDPSRTVPIATYIAIGFLAVFYAFTFWMITVAFGIDGVVDLVASDDFESTIFIAGEQYLGSWAGAALQVLIVTSFFACLLAFHNASSRYVYSLAREGLLPKRLARTHATSRSPHVASTTIALIAVVAILVAAATNADPILQLGIWSYGAGVSGLVFAQAVAAVSVIGFFARDRRGYGRFRVVVAPVIGALGLIGGFLLIVLNFQYVTGLEPGANALLIMPTPVLFVAGIVWGLVLRRRNPAQYAELAESRTD